METVNRRDREKQRKQEEIIDAAETLFCQHSFDHTTMQMIASQAQFTKRTVYQYFDNKEELYFAVVTRIFKQLVATMEQAYSMGGTGYQRLTTSMERFYRFYQQHPACFQVISLIGYVRGLSETIGVHQEELFKVNQQIFSRTIEVIAEGQADGTVRINPSAPEIGYSLIFLLTGFFNQLALTGQNFVGHFSINAEQFCKTTIDLLSNAIKPI